MSSKHTEHKKHQGKQYQEIPQLHEAHEIKKNGNRAHDSSEDSYCHPHESKMK
jgi:hypothetical protein